MNFARSMLLDQIRPRVLIIYFHCYLGLLDRYTLILSGKLTFGMLKATIIARNYKIYLCKYILMMQGESLATSDLFKKSKHSSIITGC